MSLKDLPISVYTVPGSHEHATTPGFYMHARDTHSHHHGCTASVDKRLFSVLPWFHVTSFSPSTGSCSLAPADACLQRVYYQLAIVLSFLRLALTL